MAFSEALPDVPISIIGFQIDDSQYMSQLRHWAASGGGQFATASDQQQLVEAMTSLSRVGYSVTNSVGEAVALGVSGESLSLLPGDYTVRLDTGQALAVSIQSGEVSRLSP